MAQLVLVCFLALARRSDGGSGCIAGLRRRRDHRFPIMRQLGEMVVEEPVSGSFAPLPINTGDRLRASSLAGTTGNVRAGGNGRADRCGHLYAVLFPDVPTWIWAAAFFIIINAVTW